METARIDRFTSRVDADVACAMLQARGIAARLSGDDGGGIHPDIPFGIGGTTVVVPRDQYDEAIALLDEEFQGRLGEDEADAELAADLADDDGQLTHRRSVRVFALVVAAIVATYVVAEGWRAFT